MRLLQAFAFLFSVIFFSDCHLVRGFKYRKLSPKDVKTYASLPVKSVENGVFCYEQPNKPLTEEWTKYLDTALLDSKTFAFLVIRNDTLLYEKYADGWQDDQLFLHSQTRIQKSCHKTHMTQGLLLLQRDEVTTQIKLITP